MIRSNPSPEPRLLLRVASDPAKVAEVRRAVEAFFAEAGVGQETVHQLGLCVNEALANVIRHAYRGECGRPIEVSVELHPDRAAVQIRDWGCGRLPPPRPVEKQDLVTPGGLGLVCLHRMMDDVTFTPQADGMLVTLQKRLNDGERQSGQKHDS